jgi:argininosuccinate lyase
MEAFNASIGFDKRMYTADIAGSKAYVKSLRLSGLLTEHEQTALLEGLTKVEAEWKAGKFKIEAGDEDIHTANERRLGEIIGTNISGKLHTGRSRNDQVATDMRIWLRGECLQLRRYLVELVVAIARRAESDISIIMPGFTHLQVSQDPVPPVHAGRRRAKQRVTSASPANSLVSFLDVVCVVISWRRRSAG